MAYIGKTPITGNFVKLDAITVVNGQAGYTMNNGGSAFTDYENVNQFLVSLNGILQAPTDSFTVSGSTLTFASNLATGDVIDFVIVLGNTLDIGTPSDATVTNAKTNFVSTSSSAGLQIKGDGTTDGTLQLNCSQNSHGIKLKSPAHSAGASYTLTFPTTDGNANEFLQTNGSGVMTWAEAGGGMNLLSTTSVTNASSVTINPPFSSTYTSYKIIIAGISPETTNQDLYFTFIKSDGSEETGSNYRYSIGGYRESTDSSEGTGSGSNCKWGRNVHNDAGTVNADILITNPQQSIRASVIGVTNKRFTSDATSYAEIFGCWMNTATSYTQIKFFPGSGNWNASGKIMVYGLKE